MSNDLLRDELENVGDIDMSGDVFVQNTYGLYFANVNRDKSVRILIDRPEGLSADTQKTKYPHQHPYIDVMNATTYGFCLSPRPALDISCTDATPAVAFDVSQSRKYRIVLDGQVIATAAKPSEFETLFASRGLKTAYLAKPMVFNCATYTPANKISLPITITDTTSKFMLSITDETGRQIVQSEVGYNASNIGSANVTGIVGVSKLSGTNAYLLNITLAAIASNITSRKWRFAIKPMDNKSVLLDPANYAANGYTGKDFLPTYLESSAYWCADVSQVQ